MTFKLWEQNTPYFDPELGQAEPDMEFFKGEGRGCVIVCAGGAYSHRADHEGVPVAKWLQSAGVSAFNLTYRFAPYRYKATVGDVLRAVRLARFYAAELGYDRDKIGVLGFSAGGHLASCAAVHFDDFEEKIAGDEIDRESSRPDAAVLCYPVISSSKIGHLSTFQNLLGDEFDDKKDFFSNENQIKDNTPPTFLWHTSEDDAVSVINSLRFAEGLKNKNIPFELHVYPYGGHGLGLAQDMDRVCEWTAACENWLKQLNFR